MTHIITVLDRVSGNTVELRCRLTPTTTRGDLSIIAVMEIAECASSGGSSASRLEGGSFTPLAEPPEGWPLFSPV